MSDHKQETVLNKMPMLQYDRLDSPFNMRETLASAKLSLNHCPTLPPTRTSSHLVCLSIFPSMVSSEFRLLLKDEDEKARNNSNSLRLRITYPSTLQKPGNFKSEGSIQTPFFKGEDSDTKVGSKASGDVKWPMLARNSEESKMTTPAFAEIPEVGFIFKYDLFVITNNIQGDFDFSEIVTVAERRAPVPQDDDIEIEILIPIPPIYVCIPLLCLYIIC